MRTVVKPLLEILAGIPTIVYGFFAVLVVSPLLRDLGASIGLDVSPTAAIVPGAVMGIMLIPFISSLSDDALTAVPQAMRDGAAALGATQVRDHPPGAAARRPARHHRRRAAGREPRRRRDHDRGHGRGPDRHPLANPLEAVTTTTVQIVTLLIGDHEFDSPKTLAAFGLGLVLFLSTMLLNIVALRTVSGYRENMTDIADAAAPRAADRAPAAAEPRRSRRAWQAPRRRAPLLGIGLLAIATALGLLARC